jgi:formate dehydrogenase (coenzyme F420) beta subunit
MKPVTKLIEAGKKGVTAALTAFFKRLLEEKLVDALLVPQRAEGTVVMTLVRKPERVECVDPVSPVMISNAATVVSELTSAPVEEKIAVLLRPCEARALVELVKLKQASTDGLFVFGIDCYGSFTVPDFKDFAAEAEDTADAFLEASREGGGGERLRAGCSLCVRTEPTAVDVALRLFGEKPGADIPAVAKTEKGKELLDKMGLPDGKESGEREKVLAALLKERKEALDAVDISDFLSLISNCIRCYNCRAVCPICHCKECLFDDSSKLGYGPERYLSWAARKGALRMPVDTLLFHLTRLNHMVSSCVACGMCEAACPNDIPLAKMYASIGAEVGRLFEYEPGRSLDEEVPLATFKEDELQTVED